MATLEILLLGRTEFRLHDDGGSGELRLQPQQAALIVFLALSTANGRRTRDELIGAFWPERTEPRARAALSQALYRLRSALPDGLLNASGDREVALHCAVDCCDVTRFRAALAAGRFEEALQLYRGDLTPGFHLSGAPEFQRWLDETRSALSRQAVQAASELATRAERAGTLAAQVRWLERALTLQPYDESFATALVNALAASGDAPGAVIAHETFATRLRNDLELDPSAEFIALRGRLRRTSEARHDGTAPVQPGDSGGQETGVSPSPTTATRMPSNPSADLSRTRLSRRRRRVLATATGMIAAVAAGVWAYSGWAAAVRPALRENRILVSALRNETRDTLLDDLGSMAADWITRGFAEIGGVEVVQHYSGFADELRESASPREAALASGAGLFLTGSVRRSDDSLVFEARIDNVEDATVVRVLPPVRFAASEAGRGVGRLSDLATGALATHLDPRLTQWAAATSQPPDLDAYRIFVQGLDQFLIYPMDWDAAQASFLRAFSRDSMFHTALLWGLYASGARGDFPLAESLMRLLEERRELLTAWEQAFLDAQANGFKGDRERSYRAWKELVSIAPNSAWKHNLAMAAYGLNRHQEAAALFRINDPPRGWMRDSPFHGYYFTRALHMLGRHEEELVQARAWVARFPTHANATASVPVALAALGRIDEAMAYVDSIRTVSEPLQLRIALPSVAMALAAHGYEGQARTVFGLTASTIEASGDFSAPARFTYARSLFRSGEPERARRELMQLAESTPRHAGVLGELAIVSLALGDRDISTWTARLEKLGNDYQRARILAVMGQGDSAATLLSQFRGPDPLTLHHTPEFRMLQSVARFRELLRPKG